MWEQAVKKTAATFAPRSSTKSKNPAVPGSTLYTVFEVQGYVSMVLGGLLSYNLVFPSSEPDLWRLMGMWSVWMFSMYLSTMTSTFNPFWHSFYIACNVYTSWTTSLILSQVCISTCTHSIAHHTLTHIQRTTPKHTHYKYSDLKTYTHNVYLRLDTHKFVICMCHAQTLTLCF